MAGLIAPNHTDEDAARSYLEKQLWPDGPVCPHCGLIGEAYKLEGETTRNGLYKCAGCRQPFTVTVGTIFEDSKIPLHKWLFAIYLMCSSKKGMSAHQLWRNLWGTDENGKQLGSYKTAWFMCHRIRWALGQEPVSSKLKGVFEIDEVWIGGKQRLGSLKTEEGKYAKLWGRNVRDNKTPVTTILHRDGDVRSHPMITGEQLRPILGEMVEQAESHIMTDSASKLRLSKYGWKHSAVNHSKHVP